MTTAEHWDAVHGTKASDETSWFQAVPVVSLRLIAAWAPPPAALIDVGAGRSMLGELLLDAGWDDVTVLDISDEALRAVRSRSSGRAASLSYVVADVCSWMPERTYGVWHDRAVFHFLVESEDRARYLATARRALVPGGVAVVATFADDGPSQCSGLPTARYGPDELAAVFGPDFAVEHTEREEHVTPSGAVQPFSWAVLRRSD